LFFRLSELVLEYSLEDIWTVLDPKTSVSISCMEFVETARELGFTRAEAKKLFACLDIYNSDLLTIEELEFLTKWNFYREFRQKGGPGGAPLEPWRQTSSRFCYQYATQRTNKVLRLRGPYDSNHYHGKFVIDIHLAKFYCFTHTSRSASATTT